MVSCVCGLLIDVEICGNMEPYVCMSLMRVMVKTCKNSSRILQGHTVQTICNEMWSKQRKRGFVTVLKVVLKWSFKNEDRPLLLKRRGCLLIAVEKCSLQFIIGYFWFPQLHLHRQKLFWYPSRLCKSIHHPFLNQYHKIFIFSTNCGNVICFDHCFDHVFFFLFSFVLFFVFFWHDQNKWNLFWWNFFYFN